MEIFKCKIDELGFIDKLKCHIVFRGDLYDPTTPLDSWNPHADWISIRIFFAFCACHKIFPCQIDFVMAYNQVKMLE